MPLQLFLSIFLLYRTKGVPGSTYALIPLHSWIWSFCQGISVPFRTKILGSRYICHYSVTDSSPSQPIEQYIYIYYMHITHMYMLLYYINVYYYILTYYMYIVICIYIIRYNYILLNVHIIYIYSIIYILYMYTHTYIKKLSVYIHISNSNPTAQGPF
jgi:hypothetical protein